MGRILSVFIFLGIGYLWAQEPELQEVFASAEGIGKAPEGASGPQKKLLAKRASQVIAMKNLKDALLKLSGLVDPEFYGIEKLMTFYEVKGPTVLENGDAQTTISLSKQQVLLHYVGLYKELQNNVLEMQKLQNNVLEMQQFQAEQQKRIELLEQEKKILQSDLEDREKVLDIILKATPKPVEEHTDSEICRTRIEEQEKQIHSLKKELESQKEIFEITLELRQQLEESRYPSLALNQILQELKDLRKELGELCVEVFRLQTTKEPTTEDEIDFK
ncbi:MAG: hypothetical protein AABZ60_18040 [Planctomycetota bacterium]